MAPISNTSLIGYPTLEYYAKFDNNVTDSGPNSIAGTATDTSYTAGKYGNAIAFNGITSGVVLADDANFDFTTNSFSISAWVNYAALPNPFSDAAICDKWQQDGSSNSWVFQLTRPDDTAAYRLRSYISSNGSYQSGNDKYVAWTPNLSQWYHVVLVVDFTVPEFRFYVNGVQQGSSQGISNNSIFSGDANPSIGAHMATSSSFSNFMSGYIDDIGIFSKALTLSEISYLYNESSYLDLTSKVW